MCCSDRSGRQEATATPLADYASEMLRVTAALRMLAMRPDFEHRVGEARASLCLLWLSPFGGADEITTVYFGKIAASSDEAHEGEYQR